MAVTVGVSRRPHIPTLRSAAAVYWLLSAGRSPYGSDDALGPRGMEPDAVDSCTRRPARAACYERASPLNQAPNEHVDSFSGGMGGGMSRCAPVGKVTSAVRNVGLMSGCKTYITRVRANYSLALFTAVRRGAGRSPRRLIFGRVRGSECGAKRKRDDSNKRSMHSKNKRKKNEKDISLDVIQ